MADGCHHLSIAVDNGRAVFFLAVLVDRLHAHMRIVLHVEEEVVHLATDKEVEVVAVAVGHVCHIGCHLAIPVVGEGVGLVIEIDVVEQLLRVE